MENKNEKGFLQKHWLNLLIGLVCVLILYFAVQTYLEKFNGDYSNSQTVWGAFGDYMNPFLTLINTILFIYLTYIVSQLDEHREKDRIEIENTRLRKTLKTQINSSLLQVRIDESKQIIKSLNSFFDVDSRTKDYGDKLLDKANEIASVLNSFLTGNKHLFKDLFKKPDCMDNINKIITSMNNVVFNVMDRFDVVEELNLNTEEYKSIEQTLRDYPNKNDQQYTILISQRDRIKAERTELADRLRDLFNKKRNVTDDYTMQKDKFISSINDFIITELETG